MTRYISHSNNLKLIMVLLRDRSRNVQYEAFHVFKVFVANPNKAPEILGLLTKNRRQILTFLSTFQEERTRNDNQFAEEKNFLIRQIEKLPVDE
ncbi:calcium binding protein 39 [Fonticula alba]|uniref:Calcium binding protein 39 n=1 Tax=Fonticula alba TaxID=691883 RepID=A0A058ZIW2_FONAL|nr:calcium binding protein 39 [Fonticula alba]KCV73452.1 calcium binding protein 39 [Fonticula alba]|eukprot:XP_009493153.1 calcium binding protein 39 [Fonticula alba]